MTRSRQADKLATRPIDPAAGADTDSSLLPMLVGGLILIIIGAIVVMAFV